jgi:hypothetical protein
LSDVFFRPTPFCQTGRSVRSARSGFLRNPAQSRDWLARKLHWPRYQRYATRPRAGRSAAAHNRCLNNSRAQIVGEPGGLALAGRIALPPNPVHREFGRKFYRKGKKAPCGLAATPL